MPCLSPGICYFWSSWFLLMGHGLRYLALSSGCVHYYWSVFTSGQFQWTKFGNTHTFHMYIISKYMNTYTYLCTCIHTCILEMKSRHWYFHRILSFHPPLFTYMFLVFHRRLWYHTVIYLLNPIMTKVIAELFAHTTTNIKSNKKSSGFFCSSLQSCRCPKLKMYSQAKLCSDITLIRLSIISPFLPSFIVVIVFIWYIIMYTLFLCSIYLLI